MNGTSFHAANLVLAMALELIAFAAVGYGASHLTDSTALGALLAAAAVLTSVVLWGLFAAPRARYRHPLGVLAVKALIFAAAAVAPAVNGHPILGIALASAVALNALALVGTWETRPGQPMGLRAIRVPGRAPSAAALLVAQPAPARRRL